MSIFKELKCNPVALRVIPLVVYLIFTSMQGKFGEESKYWVYFFKTIVAGILVFSIRGLIPEMRYTWSWEGVAVGIGVFVIWVGIDPLYPVIGRSGAPWNPHAAFGQDSWKAWFFWFARAFGSTLVVPMVEEVFYRSFLYRYWIRKDFQSVDLKQRDMRAALVASIVFGFAHSEWLAGILCGLAYQWVVWRRGRLGDAMLAHAITNAMLAVWVAWRGEWRFW